MSSSCLSLVAVDTDIFAILLLTAMFVTVKTKFLYSSIYAVNTGPCYLIAVVKFAPQPLTPVPRFERNFYRGI